MRLLRSSFAQIHKELEIYSQAVADWHSYASDVLLEHIVLNTEKLGGEGKTAEIDESNIGKTKYNKGHFMQGHETFLSSRVKEKIAQLCVTVKKRMEVLFPHPPNRRHGKERARGGKGGHRVTCVISVKNLDNCPRLRHVNLPPFD
ncbi:hypothetical protein TNCV_779351 [Trichonephila clavipes]|nr:hypothetical protein TNCV_779351 [Trichonephila clavipes]